MNDRLRSEISRLLPILRRHAHAMTGSQALGDACVEAAIRAFLEDPALAEARDIRCALFRALARAVDATIEEGPLHRDPRGGTLVPRAIVERVADLSRIERRVLLLHLLDGFSLEDVAHIAGLNLAEAAWLLDSARLALLRAHPLALVFVDDPALRPFLEAVRRKASLIDGIRWHDLVDDPRMMVAQRHWR